MTLLIIGHRGASKSAAENTLEAIRKAREAGADGIEVDVQLTKGGVPVLFHDKTLERLFGSRVPLADCTLADLEYISKGAFDIPTLAQALEEAKGLGVINLELKNNSRWNGRLVRAVVPILKVEPPDPLLISSFNPVAIWRIKRSLPNVRRGLIIGSGRLGVKATLVWSRILGLWSVHLNSHLARPEWIGPLKSRGLRIFIWTVDDFDDIRRLADLGADGVITNIPERVCRHFRRAGPSTTSTL